MTPEPSKTRKGRWSKRKRRLALVAGVVLLVCLALPVWRISTGEIKYTGYWRELGYRKSVQICCKCCAQLTTCESSFFGWEPSEDEVYSGGETNCAHQFIEVGIRQRGLEFLPFEHVWNNYGYSDGNFFSTMPALKGVLLSISKTNLEESRAILETLAEFRSNKTNHVLEILPGLYSKNSELLKEQLETKAFRAATGVSTNDLP
jgi:hypothetical protein